MNCRRCKSRLSAYIDGELGPRALREVGAHLEACAACRESKARLERVVAALAALPRAGLSPAERSKLAEGLRRGMEGAASEERRARAGLFPRLATAAAILVTVVVVSIALMATPTSHHEAEPAGAPAAGAAGGGPSDGRLGAGEAGRSGDVANGAEAAADTPGPAGPSILAAASLLPTPRVIKSAVDYDSGQVEEYSKDLGARLDFYSDLWYGPARRSGAPAGVSAADRSAVQQHYAGELAAMAAELGEDPESLKKSLALAASGIPSGSCAVPCFAERAFYRGRPVWIISYSSPEDSRLFANPEVASLVNLARQLAASGGVRESALMQALADAIAPGAYSGVGSTSRGAEEAVVGAGIDLQALIAELAEGSNLAAYLRRLSELDSDKLLGLMYGVASHPVQVSSSLLDTLTWRVWVIDPDGGQVLFRPSR